MKDQIIDKTKFKFEDLEFKDLKVEEDKNKF